MTTIKLGTREIKHYVLDSFTDDKPEELELCVFTLKNESHIDIGAMCYRNFSLTLNTANSESEYIRKVDLNTLDKRRIKFLRNLIDDLRLKNNIKPSSKRIMILRIMRFIHWIGQQKTDYNFEKHNDIKEAYQEYTKWLFHRIKLKDGEELKLKNNTASDEQKSARLACSLITDENIKIIEYWATPIRFNDRDSFTGTLTDNPVTDEDRFKTYAALCDFIHQTWNLWVNKRQSVLIVNNRELHSYLDLYDAQKKEELYNKVVIVALLSFIGASGSNLQVATEAELDNFDYGQTQKNTRLSGVKSRARGKTVYPEFAAKYLNIWKKWLDIRNSWLDNHNVKSKYAFPYLGNGNSIKSIPGSLTDITKPTAKLFIRHYGVSWITARDWRGFKSKLLGRATGNDVMASAEMQGHSIGTAIRHYSNRNLADSAKEISEALNAVYDSAIARSRHKEHIEVAIVDMHDPDKDTVIGGCLSETVLIPRIANGFTEHAPQPDCSIKETCLFCEKYAAHADEIDIRKLLSFKFLVNELSSTMPQTEWASRWSPYIYRVSEILDEMKAIKPSICDTIAKVTDEIDYGELDEFWLDYYKTLSHLGVVLA